MICSNCGQDKKHYAKGLCANCHCYQWRKDNPDKVRATTERSRETHAATSAKWVKDNPEKVRAYKHNRLARIRGNGGSYAPQEFTALVALYNNLCLSCGTEFSDNNKPTVDHIVPLSKGGRSSIDNIQPLCLSCNSSKNAQEIDYRIHYT